MSLDLTGLNAYTDENKMELIKKSILKGRTISYITVQPDIKSASKINIIDSQLVASAHACGWLPAGTTTLSQKDLSVCGLRVNEAVCLHDLEAYYTQKMMNPGSYNEEIPFEGIYAEEKSDKIQALIETLIWKGDTAGSSPLDLCDGLIKAIDASGVAIDGNPSGAVSITSTNIIGLVNDMVSNVQVDIIDADNLVMFVGYDTFRMYTSSLVAANLYHFSGESVDFEMFVPGTNVKIVAVAGLNGTQRMFLGQSSNFYFGTDLLNDSEDFKIFYSEDNDEVRFRANWKQGVAVAFDEMITEFSV